MNVRKAFEDSPRRVDELIEAMCVELDRVKAEFKRRLELVRFGQVDWLFRLTLAARYNIITGSYFSYSI